MSKFIEICKLVRNKYPQKIIIAGNVCTSEGVLELVMNGKVDIVKVGIGSGSCCTTRKQTGIGMPQLSAVIESPICSIYYNKIYFVIILNILLYYEILY